jgi:type II secretory pathway component PulC
MKEYISPEEKLLRLIRGAHKAHPNATANTSNPQQPAHTSLRKSWLTFPALLQNRFSVLNARKMLLLILGASLLCLVYTLIAPFFNHQTITIPKETALNNITNGAALPTETKPYESYLEGIQNRQIFAGAELTTSNAPTSGVNLDLLKDINLVGIIAGENPQAIIEDKKSQKTYYLNKGQFIGDI